MAVTLSLAQLKKQLKLDFPEFNFKDGPKFLWRPPKTIVFGPAEENDYLLALHELGHALSGHTSFDTDIRRLKIESEAWNKARDLCQKYNIEYDEDFAEAQLDTYRNWLHTKSKCKTCGLTCYQTPNGKYHCPHCDYRLSPSP